MAALAPDMHPEDVLPALARNVVTNGYQASARNEALEQTEYLKLVIRYLSPGARTGEARRRKTKSSRSKPANPPRPAICCAILGYRMRGGCGSRGGPRDGQRVARLPHHRFRISSGRAGTGAAHQPALHATITIPPESRSSIRSNTGSPPRTKCTGDFIDYFHLRSRRCAAFIWACPSSIPKPPTICAKPIPAAAPEGLCARARLLRRACSRSATARPWCPAERTPKKPGPNWPARSPDKGAAFFEKLMIQGRRVAGQLLRRPGAH